MDLGLLGRVAFVAGASSGLGLASAAELVREGCSVAICSRDEGRIESSARQIRANAPSSGQVLPLVCDVRREEEIERGLRTTVNTFGTLNILVTNAAGPPSGYVDDFDANAWRAALELNLVSTINLCRHALPYLRKAAVETGHGRIIMINSISAKQPIPNLYLSNVSRAGVLGFAKSLAEEVGAQGITVNAVLPGFTRTDRLRELASNLQEKTGKTVEDVEAAWAEANALPRLGEPEDLGSAVAFLASARAGYITGVALPVDGGRSKHLL